MLRAINSCIKIQMTVPHCVTTESSDVLRQSTLNDGSGGRSGCPIASDPRETPCRRIIPKVLYGRIVIEGDAVIELFLVLRENYVAVAPSYRTYLTG